ncbi:MAG: cytochrome C oxidase subunit IV family protein [Vicinamibacterales bacterium]
MTAAHIVPLRIYYAVFAALLVMTGLTVLVAYFNLGLLNPLVALSIAVFKATLVVLYFMHARYSPKLVWVVAVASVFWLGILLVLSLSDYLTRGWATV